MKPALYRRPVAYWAAPEIEYTTTSPTYRRPHAEFFGWQIFGTQQQCGCFFTDGLMAVSWQKFIGFYEIN